jgi:hypothetical protein
MSPTALPECFQETPVPGSAARERRRIVLGDGVEEDKRRTSFLM